MSESGERRIRRSRDEWQRLIKEQADSDQTQAAFCAEHRISVASLQNWKRRLSVPDATPAPWLEWGHAGRCPIDGLGHRARAGRGHLPASAAMLIPESQVRIWLYGPPTDMRK